MNTYKNIEIFGEIHNIPNPVFDRIVIDEERQSMHIRLYNGESISSAYVAACSRVIGFVEDESNTSQQYDQIDFYDKNSKPIGQILLSDTLELMYVDTNISIAAIWHDIDGNKHELHGIAEANFK